MKDSEYTYYSAFIEITKAISSSLDLETILHSIVKSICELTHSKGCTLMLLDEKGETLEVKSFYGLSEQYVRKGPVAADRSIADTLRGRPVIIQDAATDPRTQYPREARREGIASIVSVPIILRETTIGVLRLYTSVPCQFGEDDIHFLCAVAAQSGLAIQNARMYEDLRLSHEKRASSFVESSR